MNKLSNQSEIEKLIKEMLHKGMKVGEIQALFPNIPSATIHSLGKKLGINTRIRKNADKIEIRNNENIKMIIGQAIEKGYVEDVGKAHLLIEMINSLASTPNGRERTITVIRKQKEKEEEEREKQSKELTEKLRDQER